ncbi:hypothetical protein PV392_29555 [Streptomyces sp. ME03-5709C]|nr:hypothetical protein [Streptomyces sp. ME03-5709C]
MTAGARPVRGTFLGAAAALLAVLAAGCIHIDGRPPAGDCTTTLGLAGADVVPAATRRGSNHDRAPLRAVDPPHRADRTTTPTARPTAYPSPPATSSTPRHHKDIDIDVDLPCG